MSKFAYADTFDNIRILCSLFDPEKSKRKQKDYFKAVKMLRIFKSDRLKKHSDNFFRLLPTTGFYASLLSTIEEEGIVNRT